MYLLKSNDHFYKDLLDGFSVICEQNMSDSNISECNIGLNNDVSLAVDKAAFIFKYS